MKPGTFTTAIAILTSTVLLSCDANDYPSIQRTYYANPASVFAKFDNSSAQTLLNPAHGKPGHRCDLPVGAQLPKTDVTPLPSLAPANNALSIPTDSLSQTLPPNTALNPAHGQPGHRCDLPVGAPLNSAPPAKAAASPQLNPAHGQPGHRCDIAVGAPLNSAPVKTGMKNPATPANTNTSTTSTPPGLNPPHGQPGHRCDITVGAPLNTPAATKTDSSKTSPVPNTPLLKDTTLATSLKDSSGL